MATPTLKYVAPTTPEDELSLAPEPVVIYALPEGAVDSVNGETGTVVLSASDVGAAAAADLDNVFTLLNERVPAPPTTGTFNLHSVDGVISWVSA